MKDTPCSAERGLESQTMSFLSTGTDHPAGVVPRCEGSGAGGEVPPPVVGGLADSGPCPAQSGRGGPGEYDWQRKRQTKTN